MPQNEFVELANMRYFARQYLLGKRSRRSRPRTSKITRLLCVLCRKIEKSDKKLFSKELHAWWQKHKKNCQCWAKKNAQARAKRRAKKNRETKRNHKRVDITGYYGDRGPLGIPFE